MYCNSCGSNDICMEDAVWCKHPGCRQVAVFEGWRQTCTMIQRVEVCADHKMDLIGFQKNPDARPEYSENL